MKRILNYKAFESNMSNELTQEQTNWLNKCTRGKWKLNSETGLIDVEGSFDCSRQRIPNFKGLLFGSVSVDFICHNNYLMNLKGSPYYVGRDFRCYDNELKTLEGAPKEVKSNFYCNHNDLTSLKGSPDVVGGVFKCNNNSLRSLKEGPNIVNSSFDCSTNLLTSLEGSPGHVGRDFNCGNNYLTSMEGTPGHIGGSLYCINNTVSEHTLKRIFMIMKTGKSYKDALAEYWPKMGIKDLGFVYKDNKDLAPEIKNAIMSIFQYRDTV